MPNATQPTNVDPRAYLSTLTPDRRRVDGLALLGLFDTATGLTARMWGDSLIGYGRYRYRTRAGREEQFFMTGFSPRKTALSIHILPGYRDFGPALDRLGPHKRSVSCLYVKRFADIDPDALTEIIGDGLAALRRSYACFDD